MNQVVSRCLASQSRLPIGFELMSMRGLVPERVSPTATRAGAADGSVAVATSSMRLRRLQWSLLLVAARSRATWRPPYGAARRAASRARVPRAPTPATGATR